MDDVLNYLNQMFEAKMEHIKTNFTSPDQPFEGTIKALAALTHEQIETAVMDIFIFEMDVKREVDYIAENIVNGSRKYMAYPSPEQKNRDKQLENEFRQFKSEEYMNRYRRDGNKIYYTLINLFFKTTFLTAINELICTNQSVRQDLSFISLNNASLNELKSVLYDMIEYYASQSMDYKPIKSFINRAWNNENVDIVGAGTSGAVLGAILGGPIGMVAGAALAGMWADGKKQETYRHTRETYIQQMEKKMKQD